MIKCELDEVEIFGMNAIVMMEYLYITKSLYKQLKKIGFPEPKKAMDEIYRASYMTNKERETEIRAMEDTLPDEVIKQAQNEIDHIMKFLNLDDEGENLWQ